MFFFCENKFLNLYRKSRLFLISAVSKFSDTFGGFLESHWGRFQGICAMDGVVECGLFP